MENLNTNNGKDGKSMMKKDSINGDDVSSNNKNGDTVTTTATVSTVQNGNTSSSSSSSMMKSKNSKTTTTSSTATTSSLQTPGASSSSTTTPSSSSSSTWPQFRFATTLPLRILVLKDLVGAIIGRGGGTIRQITQETHARVDVHRKESSTANENVIMIYGNPDNCSQACRRILDVMQQEAKSLNRPDEIQLKILASNNLIGRIIGKGGNTIRRIMQQTDTKITINGANIPSQYQFERIISISGQSENMCKAEVLISQKLRQCFESDYMQYQQSLMYPHHPHHSNHPAAFHHSSIPSSSLLTPGQTAATAAGTLGLPYALAPPPPPISSHPPQPLSYPPLGASPTCTNLPLVGRGSTAAVMGGGGSSVSSQTTGGSTVAGPLSSASQTHLTQGSSAATAAAAAAAAAIYYNFPSFMFHGPQGAHHHPTLGTPTPLSPFIHGASGGPAGMQNISSPYLSSYPSCTAAAASTTMLSNIDMIKETVTIYVPNTVVGAIIGRSGTTIREMMITSGAQIKVAQLNEEETAATATTSGDSTTTTTTTKPLERRVTIYGNTWSQNQAQFFIFQKVYTELTNQHHQQQQQQHHHQQQQQQSSTTTPTTTTTTTTPASTTSSSSLSITTTTTNLFPYGNPAILKVEIMIPTNQVRRIIGKGGSVITDLQRTSGATIKLSKENTTSSSQQQQQQKSSTVSSPEESSSPNDGSSGGGGGDQSSITSEQQQQQQQDQTSVFIIGDYYSSISAQRQIRLIVHRSLASAAAAAAASSSSSSSSIVSSTTISQTTTTTTTTTTSKTIPTTLSSSVPSTSTTTTTIKSSDDNNNDDDDNEKTIASTEKTSSSSSSTTTTTETLKKSES